MNQDENRVFFQEIAFIHFPALATWMKKESLDPAKTVDAWAMTLRDVTSQEAISVVYRWTRDELPRPSYLELDDFALHLRGVVMRDRTEQRHAIALDQIKDRGETTSTNYSHVSLKPFIRRILESGEAVKAGQKTKQEHYALRDQILEELTRAQKGGRYEQGS
jgi:hypothetical protein